jgi:RimJ/RimL family protein N-acetyltransferase
MGYIFDVLQANNIITGTHPDNQPSVRLLKRLKLQEAGEGEWKMTRDEWSNLA